LTYVSTTNQIFYIHKTVDKQEHNGIGEDIETFLLPTDAHNVKKHRVIKTF